MMKRTMMGFAVSMAVGCGGASAGTDTTLPADAMTFEQAIAQARAEAPDDLPIEVELEVEGGRTLIEVESISGDRVVERFYDPATGVLVEQGEEELDEEERAALPALRQHLLDGTTSLEAVVAHARTRYPGADVREIEIEMHGDSLIFEVEVEVDGEERVLVHDPATGDQIGDETEAHED